MDGDRAFCIHCGAILQDGVEYCPECGYAIYGGMSVSSAEIDSEPAEVVVESSPAEGAVPWIVAMTTFYGFFAAFMGLYALSRPEQIVSSIEAYVVSNGVVWESFLAALDMTQDGFVRCISLSGAVVLASGIPVIASSYMVRARRHNLLAIALCSAGSLALLALTLVAPQPVLLDILAVSGLFCTVGLSAALLMHISKDAFVD